MILSRIDLPCGGLYIYESSICINVYCNYENLDNFESINSINSIISAKGLFVKYKLVLNNLIYLTMLIFHGNKAKS